MPDIQRPVNADPRAQERRLRQLTALRILIRIIQRRRARERQSGPAA